MNRQYTRWTIVLATIVTVVINIFSDIILIGGKSTAQISDSFKVYFVPAGYVFAIWGVIYLGLLAYTYFQFNNDSKKLNDIAPWYLVSCLANSAWIFLWHYEQFALTVIVMLVLLVSLIMIYIKLNIENPVSKSEKYLLEVPFSVYLGWISVAIIANITVFLSSIGYNGTPLTPQLWSALLLLIAFVLGFILLWKHRDYVYTIVIIWSALGIASKFNGVDTLVASAGFAVGICLTVAVVVNYIQSRK